MPRHTRFIKSATVFVALVTLLMLAKGGGSAAVSFPLVDDVEADLGYWVADPPWERTTNDSKSPNMSWTDSPSGYYGNNKDVSLTLASPIDLSTPTSPQLKFWHHYALENGFDFGYVEAATSTATGPWTRIAAYSGSATSPYTGPAPSTAAKGEGGEGANANAFLSTPGEPWVLEQLSLADYAGQASVWLRFRLVTDDSTVRDGWFLDDIAIAELPTPVALSSSVTSTKTSLALSWAANADSDFGSYKVYRSDKPGVTFNDTLIASIGSQGSTSATDTGLTPKTTFYYRVFVVNTSGVYSGSDEVSASTQAGLEYPFLDDMETSGANWNPQPSNVWTRVSVSDAYSGSNVWTDSPSANYGSSIDVSLVLSDTLSINADSQIVFWHKLQVLSGDTAKVEMSGDGGGTWSELTSFTDSAPRHAA